MPSGKKRKPDTGSSGQARSAELSKSGAHAKRRRPPPTKSNLKALKRYRNAKWLKSSTRQDRQLATLYLACAIFGLSLTTGCATVPMTTAQPIEEDCPQMTVTDPALLATPRTDYAERLRNLWLSPRSATGK